MSSKQPVRLKELPGGAIRDAVLLDGMGKEEVEAAQGSWGPFLESELARLKNEGVPPATWPQHRHWDWREKQKTIDGLLAYGSGVCCTCRSGIDARCDRRRDPRMSLPAPPLVSRIPRDCT